jgi:hypothetical protein
VKDAVGDESALVPMKFLDAPARAVERAEARVAELEAALEDARERLVTIWHEEHSLKPFPQLHEFLGMSWEEYAAWVERRPEIEWREHA